MDASALPPGSCAVRYRILKMTNALVSFHACPELQLKGRSGHTMKGGCRRDE